MKERRNICVYLYMHINIMCIIYTIYIYEVTAKGEEDPNSFSSRVHGLKPDLVLPMMHLFLNCSPSSILRPAYLFRQPHLVLHLDFILCVPFFVQNLTFLWQPNTNTCSISTPNKNDQKRIKTKRNAKTKLDKD